MNYKLLVDTAVLAGEIMLVSGAETYRVEDTICRILKTSGLETCEGFVVSTGIVVTLSDSSIDAITQVKRVGERSTNLGRIYRANDISRRLCNHEISESEAYEQLKALKKENNYKEMTLFICIILTSVSFSVLLGASWLECLIAGFNGLFVVASEIIYAKIRFNRFVMNLCVSFIIAVTTMAFTKYLPFTIDMEPVIVGSIMALLPGVAITNAIRDTLQGDYMSGGAKVIEAFLIASSLAVGIGGGLAFGRIIMGGV
ncbi:MAG: threonine/serine exporter family protein [Lachnospiraceae bacterium]|nr:threonine/serine exporter family protein [Lachnospiraceae bacterium]